MHTVTDDDKPAAAKCWEHYRVCFTDELKDALIRTIDRERRKHRDTRRDNPCYAMLLASYERGRQLWRCSVNGTTFLVIYAPVGKRILSFTPPVQYRPEGRCKTSR